MLKRQSVFCIICDLLKSVLIWWNIVQIAFYSLTFFFLLVYSIVKITFYPCFLCLFRNPVAFRRPHSAGKQQKKDSPGLHHRAAGESGQANIKPERSGLRDGRGVKAKANKVGLQLIDKLTGLIDARVEEYSEILIVINLFFSQGKERGCRASRRSRAEEILCCRI